MTARDFHIIRSREAARRMNEEFKDRRESGSDLVVVSKYGAQRDIGGTIEIKYDQEVVADWFDEEIPDAVLDLIEIALATYTVDKRVERGISIPRNDDRARINTRNIRFSVPVLSAALSGNTVKRLLGETVSRTSRDLVEYDIHRYPVSSGTPLPENRGKVDSVGLFSGGIDSTGGVYHNRREGINASYLSLNYAGVGTLIDHVGDQVDISPTVIGIQPVGSSREFTQFSRGFLHLAFGVAAALGQGASTVQCFENGLVARFDMLQDGWMTTRTVRPEFVNSFNALLRESFGERISVDNPFTDRTKTEVVNLIPDRKTVLDTVSCPHSSRFNGVGSDQQNCGLCVPCLIRTISLRASNHRDSGASTTIFSPFEHTDFDRLATNIDKWNPDKFDVEERAVSPEVFVRSTIEIAYFCRHLLNGEERVLAADHPELYDASVLDLHRRFAREFETAIESFAGANQTAEHLLSR